MYEFFLETNDELRNFENLGMTATVPELPQQEVRQKIQFVNKQSITTIIHQKRGCLTNRQPLD
jgi:hypothetical protein